jgi:multidrug efflux system membrane fusion protein
VTAKPVVVTQQNEADAVIASGLSPSDRVVTTGFANLSDGAKSSSARRSRRRLRICAAQAEQRDAQGSDAQGKDGQGERRGKRGERSQARAIKGSNRTRASKLSRRAAERSHSHDRKIRRLNV